ncbi:MAG: exodeoxyribonuclease VII large subunit [Hyphomicrobiales bacterium]|nr:exodeoxyribonuclease VII large subunit [Hyphomicrobiales bacterium]PCH50498.1 MAG: exodeoxyribonuclease VII large subunit [Hyphomicrobiales bacterium]
MPEEDKSQSNALEVSVSEISGKLKRMVEDTFGHVRVRGEITGYRGPHSSGHMYFALKDERARIEAVVWRGVANKLKHKPEEGLEVIASGKLTTYPGSSKYQIVIDNIEPAGAGALMALLEDRKKKLAAEGLFVEDRKQLLPYMPKVIGVITSPTGAVIRDVLHRISDRFPLHVLLWPARVQGETCGPEVSAAVRGFNALEKNGPIPKPDLIIVARGGGSVEDLWGFNDEELIRAVADSEIPVISAVGHETDWTLVDLAADIRAPTPTGAAEMAVPVKSDLEAHVASLNARLNSGLTRTLENARTSLKAAGRGMPTPDTLFSMPRRQLDEATTRLTSGLILATQKKQIHFQGIQSRLNPNLLMPVVQRRSQEVGYLHNRLSKAISTSQERANLRIGQATRLLNSYSYTNTLQRGYAVVRDDAGKLVTLSKKISDGQLHELEFSDGRVNVIAGNNGAKSKTLAKTKKQSTPTTNQGDLF